MGLTEFLLVVAVLGGIIAVLYPTLRGAAREGGVTETEPALEPDDEAGEAWLELEERRHTVLRSLDEIAADREAGNISEDDYRSLRRRYEAEAAAVLREQSELEAAESTSRRGRGRETAAGRERSRLPAAVGWGVAVIAFAALAALALDSALRSRGEGDVITGNLPSSGMEASQGDGALMPVDRERLAELEARVADDSSDVGALAELGHLYLSTQQFDRVARVSMKALSIEPDEPESLTHLGMVLVAANHVSEAISAFDRALQIDPDFPEALLYRGIVAFQNREFETAVDSWEHYLEVAPPDADVGRVRAMLQGARAAVQGDGSG